MEEGTSTQAQTERRYRWAVVAAELAMTMSTLAPEALLPLMSLSGIVFGCVGIWTVASNVRFLLRHGWSVGMLCVSAVGVASASAAVLTSPNAWKRTQLVVIAAVALALSGLALAIVASKSREIGGARVDRVGHVARGSVIVVLGTAVRDGRPTDDLESRLATALSLGGEARQVRYLVTGAADADGGEPEAHVMRDWLVAHGVTASSVIVDDMARNTAENLRNAYRMGRRASKGKLIVVTSDYHVCRTRRIASELGIEDELLFVAAPVPPASRRQLVGREALALLAYDALHRDAGASADRRRRPRSR